MNARRRLTLVAPGDQLTGIAPIELEQAARACHAGDATHRGLLFLSATLARRAVLGSIAPSVRQELLTAIDAVEAWARGESQERAIRDHRALCFSALPVVEKKTIEAVESAQKHLGTQRKTGLDSHAELVLRRYVALGAHCAASAAVLTLDAVSEPARITEVPQQVLAARAYQATGLGAARHGEFRAKAWEQAEWEAAREGAPTDHGIAGLALQIFHEYLGARWKSYADSERIAQREFIAWCLGGLEQTLPLKM
jgi:hypothetical protein